MTVSVCFTNFGPYHLARLRALADRLGRGGDRLIAYEVAGRERTYPWKRNRHDEPFTWNTLFPDRVLETIQPAHCRQAMVEALDRDRPDSLGIVGYARPESMAAARWANRHDRPAILMSESHRIDRPRTWWKELIKQRRLRRFDAALVGGPLHRDYLANLGMPPERVALGYNAVDNDFFTNEAHRWRENPEGRAGLPSAHYFLSVCRFVPEKNLVRLVRAFARYRQQSAAGAAWDLVLCGDGPGSAEVDEAIARSGCKQAIHRPGFLQADSLPRWYAHAGAFVLASLSEPWGLVVNEAAASGLPLLVSTHAGCAPTLVPEPEGTTGSRFNPLDVEAMTSKLAGIAALSDEARRATGRRAAGVVSHWGLDRFARGVMEALELAGTARRRRGLVKSRACVGSSLIPISLRFLPPPCKGGVRGVPSVKTRVVPPAGRKAPPLTPPSQGGEITAAPRLKCAARVLHLCNGLDPVRDGGMVPSILGMTGALSRQGGELTIVTATPSRLEGTVLVEDVKLQGPETDLEQVIRSSEVVHLHGLWQAQTRRGARTARAARVPYLVAAHGMAEPWALRQKRWKKQIYLALVEARNLRRASCLHALSRPEIGHLQSIAAWTPICFVPNGVDLALYDALPARTVLEAEHAELEGKFILLFFGRVHVKKGLDLLAEALGRVAADRPDLHLVVAGNDDGAWPGFRDRMAQLGLTRRLTYLGHVSGERARQVWAAADAFILPSYSEGFSMAVLEALACRLPSLITTACHFPEVGAAGGAIVVTPDAGALTQGLRDLLDRTHQERALLGQNGRRLVEDQYTWDRQAERLAAVYEWLTGGGTPPEVVVT